MDENNNIEQIYRSRINILKMLNYRGFNTEKYDNFNIVDIDNQYKGFNEKIAELPYLSSFDIYASNETNKTNILVKYIPSYPKNISAIEKLITTIATNKDTEGIPKINMDTDCIILMFLKGEILFNDTARIPEYNKIYWDGKKYFVQFYCIRNFLFNIVDSVYVSKHELISDAEIKEVMAKYNLTSLKDFETIKREDPMAKYIGMRPMQVCKITYYSPSSLLAYNYRLCQS